MNYGQILSYLAPFFGVTSTFAYLHQAYFIWKRKSSADISIFTFSYFFAGQLVFLLYGLHNNDIPLIITFVANMIGSGVVIVTTLIFRKPKAATEEL